MENLKIGIPRAMLYYYFKDLWHGFFEELGVKVVLSPETNKDIVKRGVNAAVDEGCFSSKVFLGHVSWLIDKCDMVFVPRVEATGIREEYCTRIYGLYDLVKSTFPGVKILSCDVNVSYRKREREGFVKIGEQIGFTAEQSLVAYTKATEKFIASKQAAVDKQNELLKTENMKVLLVAHAYNSYDYMIGREIVKYFNENKIDVLFADVVDENLAREKVGEHYKNRIYWKANRDIIGGIEIYKENVDGIVQISTFPCGPDSIFNELIIRKNTDKPILSLVIDELDASAGIITRLESFVDLLYARKKGIKYAE